MVICVRLTVLFAVLSRVVLPSDELVRVTCVESDARVRAILSSLYEVVQAKANGDPLGPPVATGDKKNHQRKNRKPEPVDKRSQQQVFPLNTSASSRPSPLGSATKAKAPKVPAVWNLVLVRTGQVLDLDAFVRDALQDLDILDCRPQPKSQTSMSSTKQVEPVVSAAPRILLSSPAHMIFEPELCKANAQFARRIFTRKTLVRATRRRKLKIAAGDDWRGGHSWSHFNTFMARSSFSTTPPPSSSSPESQPETAVLLRGGMQLLDQLSTLETEVSSLLLFVRDSNSSRGSGSGGGAGCKIKIEELLPSLLRVFRALFQHKQQLLTMTKFPIAEGNYTQDLSRALKDATTESLLPEVPVLMQGWVACAEWGAFWRSTRRDYACLCDDDVLSFFASERQCSEYLFALTRARNGHSIGGIQPSSSSSEPGGAKKDPLKTTNAPQSQIDLADATCGWSVRKGDTGDTSDRHAFALFDSKQQKSKLQLRLIVDVDSDDDASKWVATISAELKQSEALTDLASYYEALFHGDNENTAAVPQSPAPPPAAAPQSFTLPLRWLHAQMERVNGRRARHQRLQCVNLSQAVKDFRRDRIQINGLLYRGACVDEMLIALTTKILSTLTTAPTAPKQRLAASTGKRVSETPPLEMIAMRLAKELLVCSSRTDGGGDILDALHLVFPSTSFSVCPRAKEMAPIAVSLSTESGSSSSPSCGSESATPMAEIMIVMRYWVILSGSEQPRSADAEAPFEKKSGDNHGGNLNKLEVVGTYFKKLIGDFYNWHEVEGHVDIAFLH